MFNTTMESMFKVHSLTGQEFDDLSHLFLEADLKNPVSLVDHQTLEAVVDEPRCVLGEKEFCVNLFRERGFKSGISNYLCF